MKHGSFASFALTILLATLCGAWISHTNAREATIRALLHSSASIDQLEGIKLVQHESFDSLIDRLVPLLQGDAQVVKAASESLAYRAFRESRIQELEHVPIDPSLLTSIQWWSSHELVDTNPHDESTLACDATVAPWLRRLASLQCDDLHATCRDELVTMPLLDRDGSVLLAALSIHKHTGTSLTSTWDTSIDKDRRKIAVLLGGLAGLERTHADSDPHVHHIAKILSENSSVLAWRAMHQKNGFIDPDVFLAGLIVDREGFLQLLVETEQKGLWQHPDHSVVLAQVFAPKITSAVPIELLGRTRDKWWELFSCGLLLEEGQYTQ
ncbi:MAG: hypothetical protein QGI78_02425 [Phycisphaerales bacterium]|jgi:hypothetical protein|nr:hypothetical protein [Phycisphaerales bacterium]